MHPRSVRDIQEDIADLTRHLVEEGEAVTCVTIIIDGPREKLTWSFGHVGDLHGERLNIGDCDRLEVKLGLNVDRDFDSNRYSEMDDDPTFV